MRVKQTLLALILIAAMLIAMPVTAFADDEYKLGIFEGSVVLMTVEGEVAADYSGDLELDSTVYAFENGYLKTVDGGIYADINIDGTEYYTVEGLLFSGQRGKRLYRDGIASDYTGYESIDGEDYFFVDGFIFSGIYSKILYEEGIKSDYTGYKTVDDVKYYFKSGKLLTGIYKKSYFKNGIFDDSVNGYKKVGGVKYHFTKGKLSTKIIKSGKGKIYLKDGLKSTKTGIITYAKKKYYIKKGTVKTGKIKYKKKYYYFAKSGVMQTNKNIKIGKIWYHAAASGVLVKKSAARIKAMNLLKKITASSDSKYAKLQKAYYWTRCGQYGSRAGYVTPSGKNWVLPFASDYFTYRRGRCYSFAAAFATLAKEIGYSDVTVIIGKCNGFSGSWSTHSWVEIVIGGETRVFDPEYDWNKGSGTSMFDKTYATACNGYIVGSHYQVKD